MAHIYTRSGDNGQTSFFNGTRVLKNDSRVKTYGEVDELISMLAFAKSLLCVNLSEGNLNNNGFKTESDSLQKIERVLFSIGFELANPDFDIKSALFNYVRKIDVDDLESSILDIEAIVPALSSFILPEGSMASSYLQVCRAKTRSLERTITEFAVNNVIRAEVKMYINRLSDYLFMLARLVNFRLKNNEINV